MINKNIYIIIRRGNNKRRRKGVQITYEADCRVPGNNHGIRYTRNQALEYVLLQNPWGSSGRSAKIEIEPRRRKARRKDREEGYIARVCPPTYEVNIVTIIIGTALNVAPFSLSLSSLPDFSRWVTILFHDDTPPPLSQIASRGKGRKEGETEGAINFHGPSTLAPSVFSLSIGETDTRAVYSYAIQRMVEEKAWDDVSLAAVRLIILSLSLSSRLKDYLISN